MSLLCGEWTRVSWLQVMEDIVLATWPGDSVTASFLRLRGSVKALETYRDVVCRGVCVCSGITHNG